MTVETLWFCLVAAMIAAYVVLDGFDLGAGIVHLVVARTDAERRLVLRSIGPFWDGNEVWLLAAGGTLYFAFPALYASSFSGFYLPLMIVLWLLILRGIAIEFRGHVDSPTWKPLWDAVFSLSSALLAIFYGAALGNVVRGVPLDADGWFFEPLWTDFRLGPEPGIIDWYTVLVGLLAFAALAAHGALWVALRTDGALRDRARRLGRLVWWGVAGLTAIVTLATFRVQPGVPERLGAHHGGLVFPLLAIDGHAERARAGRRPAGVRRVVRVSRRDAGQRRLRRLPLPPARRHRPRLRADRAQRGRLGARPQGRARLVDPGHGAGGVLLHLRLQNVRGEGAARGRGLLSRSQRLEQGVEARAVGLHRLEIRLHVAAAPRAAPML